MKEIPDGSVDLILTDLPYGTTQNKWDSVIPFEPLWGQYWRILKKNGAVVLTAMQPFTSALVMSQPKAFKYQWVWEKTQVTGFLNAKIQPLRRHEDILVFYKSQPTYNPQFKEGAPYKTKRATKSKNYGSQRETSTVNKGIRYPTSILTVSQNRIEKGHPTQKPVALMEYMIKTYTNEGETVLDSTMGSGTTGVAAHNTGRKFIGIELDLGYFETAKNRILNSKNLSPQ